MITGYIIMRYLGYKKYQEERNTNILITNITFSKGVETPIYICHKKY